MSEPLLPADRGGRGLTSLLRDVERRLPAGAALLQKPPSGTFILHSQCKQGAPYVPPPWHGRDDTLVVLALRPATYSLFALSTSIALRSSASLACSAT